MAATIWGWGEDFEYVKTNIEKYISKKWEESTKECSIDLMARERNEGICYYITAYVDNPKNVGSLAEGLFYVAFDEGDTKVDSIKVQLFDVMVSDEEIYRKSIREVKNMLKEFEKLTTKKFSDHPKLKSVKPGKKIVFVPEISLLYELESKLAIKITMEVVHEDFSLIRNLLRSLSNRMIKRGLA